MVSAVLKRDKEGSAAMESMTALATALGAAVMDIASRVARRWANPKRGGHGWDMRCLMLPQNEDGAVLECSRVSTPVGERVESAVSGLTERGACK